MDQFIEMDNMTHSPLSVGARAVLSFSSRRREGNTLWVLIYHQVLEKQDPLRSGGIDRRYFESQMLWLAKYFNVLSLKEAFDRLETNRLPPRAAAITFDDGYSDNLNIAAPILNKYKLPATVFVSTGFLDGGRMWNDTIIESIRNWPKDYIDLDELGLGIVPCQSVQEKSTLVPTILNAIKHREPEFREGFVKRFSTDVADLPTDLMLTTSGVRELYSQGIEIGAHTVNHPILACLDKSAAKKEIADSKNYLENIIQDDVTFFAYPNGRYGDDYNLDHVDMLGRLGFRGAVSTHWGVSDKDTDIMQLPRFTPWDNRRFNFLRLAFQNYRNAL